MLVASFSLCIKTMYHLHHQYLCFQVVEKCEFMFGDEATENSISGGTVTHN